MVGAQHSAQLVELFSLSPPTPSWAGAADFHSASSGPSWDVCVTPQAPRVHLYLGFNVQGPSCPGPKKLSPAPASPPHPGQSQDWAPTSQPGVFPWGRGCALERPKPVLSLLPRFPGSLAGGGGRTSPRGRGSPVKQSRNWKGKGVGGPRSSLPPLSSCQSLPRPWLALWSRGLAHIAFWWVGSRQTLSE